MTSTFCPDDLDLVSSHDEGRQVPVRHALSQEPPLDSLIACDRPDEVEGHPAMRGDHHELAGLGVVNNRIELPVVQEVRRRIPCAFLCAQRRRDLGYALSPIAC